MWPDLDLMVKLCYASNSSAQNEHFNDERDKVSGINPRNLIEMGEGSLPDGARQPRDDPIKQGVLLH